MYRFRRFGFVSVAFLLGITFVFTGCPNLFDSDSEPDDSADAEEEIESYPLQGLVQKGPYVTGTEVTVREIDSEFNPTGRTFATTIDDDTGSFAIEVELTSPFVVLSASGYYYNEISGTLSSGTLPLQALANLEDSSSVNLNILTHLQRRRMEHLIENGSSFSEARQQSLNDLREVFSVDEVAIDDFTALDISKAGGENAALLSVSAIVLGNRSEATVTELLSRIGTDIRTDGTLDSSDIYAQLLQGAESIDPARIRTNLENRYESLGVQSNVADFSAHVVKFLNDKSSYSPEEDDSSPLSDLPTEAQNFISLMNDHRESKGEARLEWNSGLGDVALAHSQDMKDRGFFSHTNPDGDDPFDRMTTAGISYQAAGENIAMGQTTGQAVFDSWINSTGHRENIENTNYTHHGLGYVEDGHYWTHVFAKNPSVE